MTDREGLLDELRPVAFAVAYRMLGTVSEAEDVVQEALLRVHQALDAGERIESPCAYVTTIATRLAINELRSARARRGRAAGPAGPLRHPHPPPPRNHGPPPPPPPRRAVRRRMAPRADRHRRRGRSRPPRRDRRLALAGDAGPAREPLPRAARCP